LTFAPLVSCATTLGLTTTGEDHAVVVRVDEATSIRFTVRDGHYDMVIAIDTPGMTAAEAERQFARALRTGRKIWRTGLAAMAEWDAPLEAGGACERVTRP
jgi:ketopantoate hydroxymethyltransferase